MNINGKIILEDLLVKEDVFINILKYGNDYLDKTRNLNLSFSGREVFGLYVILSLRRFLEPEKKWGILESKDLSDDGAVGYYEYTNSIVNIKYCELVEQVYLPKKYLSREKSKDLSVSLVEHIKNIKFKKGFEYRKNKSLFVLSDFSSIDYLDTFNWNIFLGEIFKDNKYDNFLHIYFLTLKRYDSKNKTNDYYLLSLSNQKHRQDINGEFEFTLSQKGISNFRCIQNLNFNKNS